MTKNIALLLVAAALGLAGCHSKNEVPACGTANTPACVEQDGVTPGGKTGVDGTPVQPQ